jgi:serine/threonine-protein kinase
VNQSELGGRYRVEARIGAGGMAEVYRGFDPVLNRTVAIKVLNPQFARDAGFVARFRREAQAAARLSHDAIVGVYDTGADGDTQYIVMEFIEGRTLADFLSSGRRPSIEQSVELSRRIATALGVAHAQGIVHRDIKPANVMITREGRVKVMDFGIARMQTVETAPQTSSVLGTPTYLSPEQAQGQSVDARSDLYSLGVVLYELLTGRPPFTGDSPVAIAYKQVNEIPVPPSQLNSEVPAALDAVVMKALAKNPANRYQTAEEFSADLERVQQGKSVEATPLLVAGGDATQVIARPQATQVLPPTEEPKGSSRKVWLGILIGILAVAVLAGGGYLLAQTLLDDTETSTFGMPNLVGMTLEEATQEIQDRGLVLGETRRQQSEEPEGTVLDQDPASGTLVESGETVDLRYAVPIKTVIVPDLLCQPAADASNVLLEYDLRLGTTTTQESTECDGEAGLVISQDPPADTEVEQDSPVNIVISGGPGTVTIGDYTCDNFNAAKNELRQLGITAVFGGTVPVLPQCPNRNFVAQQDPPPGSEVEVGGSVTLFTGEEASPTASPT